VIGEIFDRVYDQASLTSAPLTDVQTTLVRRAAPPWWS
jgi:nitrite reductase (NO-forming)